MAVQLRWGGGGGGKGLAIKKKKSSSLFFWKVQTAIKLEGGEVVRSSTPLLRYSYIAIYEKGNSSRMIILGGRRVRP